jgi:IS5 family transposase
VTAQALPPCSIDATTSRSNCASSADKIKWRTGSEGRINHLKRSYAWDRTELTGINGARTWCGHGAFAHNLVKISALAA